MARQNWEIFIDTLLEEFFSILLSKDNHGVSEKIKKTPLNKPLDQKIPPMAWQQSLEDSIVKKYLVPLSTSRYGYSDEVTYRTPVNSHKGVLQEQNSSHSSKTLTQPLTLTSLHLVHSDPPFQSTCHGKNLVQMPSPKKAVEKFRKSSASDSLETIINRYTNGVNQSKDFIDSINTLKQPSQKISIGHSSSGCGACFSYRLDRYLLVNRHDQHCR